jgi:hypothetical protein
LCKHINLWFPISEKSFNPAVTCCSSNSMRNHLFKGITCLTQPKALNRSQKMPTICIRWFSEVGSVSIKVKVAFWMYFFAYKNERHLMKLDCISKLNLLNAELNPSCKSQLAEFFWVGI